jgi:hypothetical protein
LLRREGWGTLVGSCLAGGLLVVGVLSWLAGWVGIVGG